LLSEPEFDDVRAKRNALILACAQALFTANTSMLITMGGLSGHMLSPDKALATLPVSFMTVGAAAATIPASLLMRHAGRRVGFIVGALFAIAGAALSAWAIAAGSFPLLVAGFAVSGVYQGFGQFYRLAAADVASPVFRPKAISWVLTGGVAAALIGPELFVLTKDALSPLPFAGAFVALTILGGVAVIVLAMVDIPQPSATELAGPARPLKEIARQPAFMVAMACGIVSYAVMNLLMTATPLAMVGCALPVDDAAFVIQWHVIAMFAPSFLTGWLIQKFGLLRMMAAGLFILAACVAVAATGVTLAHFWGALVLLGLGWNFGYVGATTLLTETYTPAERGKTQALNDFTVFFTVVCASFASGGLLHWVGWTAMTLVALPAVSLALASVLWLQTQRRGRIA